MIFQLNKQEEKKAKAIEEKYRKLITKASDKVSELREDKDFDIEKYNRIQDSRLPEPIDLKPKPIRLQEDGSPVFSKEELNAYYNSKEYKAYKRAQDKANKAVNALWKEWYNKGSEEWKIARKKRLDLMREYSEKLQDYLTSVYDSHFDKIAQDPNAIVKSAYEETDYYIESTYQEYERIRTSGRNANGDEVDYFSAEDVRATETGLILDEDETLKRLLTHLSRHIEALKEDKKRIKLINDYIVKAVLESPLTSSTEGIRYGEIKTAYFYEITEEKEPEILATRPKDYVTTVDRVTKKLFDNEITKADSDPDALYNVRLDDKGKVFVRAAIDYSDLLKKSEIYEIPELDERDYNVHDAVLTHYIAGNRVISYDMMYRAMTGKVTGKIKVPDEAMKIIDKALDKSEGRLRLKYEYIDETGQNVERTIDEPLLTFQRITDKVKVNGKVISGGIRLPDDINFMPPLLRWAKLNGNEIDTRDITLLDVPRLNNGDESFTIKMCLYRRIISMRNLFERKYHSKKELPDNQRSIRYDYIYSSLDLKEPDKNKRRLLKDKIDRCMKYWKDKGLIADYRHKTDKSAGNAFFAVEVAFMPSEK